MWQPIQHTRAQGFGGFEYLLTLLLALGQCSGLPVGVSEFKLFVMCCETCVSVDIVAVFEQFKRPNAYQLALYLSANFSEKING